MPALVWQKESKERERVKRVVTLEKEKIIRQAIDDKENWGKEEEMKKDYRKMEEMVPRRFLKQKRVFRKVESKRMLTRKTWNHAIDLKEMFKLQKGRIYLLLKDQLRKGYIRPSKSPQMSLVFFVGKKDSNKRMVMNYCNLNDQTIKNNYLLPLITELIDNMGSKKVFTKMDLRQGFNNMRIKEKDE